LGTAATVVSWGTVPSPTIESRTDTERQDDDDENAWFGIIVSRIILPNDRGAKDSVIVPEESKPKAKTK
jgi:hypothetical protein